MTLRFVLSSLVLFSGSLVVGCSTTSPGGTADTGVTTDAAATDSGSVDDASATDAAPMADTATDAPSCSCRSGAYHATGTGSGFTVDYDFDVAECDGALVCHVGHSPSELAPTPCMMTSDGVFRVYLDEVGYVQLIFSSTPCDAPWTGTYATEGGTASVTATRT